VSRILRLLNPGAEERATLNEPPDWMWDAFGGTRSQTGETVSERGALGLIAVWAAVRLLAGAVAQCPLIVYSGEGGERTRARDTWQWTLLHDRPNRTQPPDLFFETLMGHENLWGNFYAEKAKARVGARTVVGELWPVQPSRVAVERDADGNKRFSIDGEARTYGADTILHIPGFGYDGMKGLSPIGQAREELGVALAMQRFSGRAFANSGRHAGVLKMPLGKKFESTTKRDEFVAHWRAAMGSNGTPVLEDGTDWAQIGMPIKDMELVAIMRFTVNHVARIFQVPPEMIGGERTDSMVYSNVEGQALHFVKFSLSRWLVRIEQALRHDPDLFPEGSGLYPEFLVEGLLRGDTVSRSAFYTSMFNLVDNEGKRALGVDEIRDRENLPPAVAEPDAPPPVVP
jgi:HK97 family phage portal protein